MSLRVTTPPDPLVTLPEARAHLRFFDPTYTDEDTYIQALIDAACANIDGPDGWLGRAIGEQTIELTLDGFMPRYDPANPLPNMARPWPPSGRASAINLPLPPSIDVTSVTYTKPDGTTSTVTDYRKIRLGANTGSYLLPAVDTDWPETIDEPASVVIVYTAGFSAVPKSIKHAVLLLVSHLFEHREAAVDTGAKFGLLELPFGVKSMLEPHRYWPAS